RERAISVGVRISGSNRQVELMDIQGPMRASIELVDAAAVSIHGCLIHASAGPALTMDATTDVTLANNTFIRIGGKDPALVLKDGTRPILARNLFAGFGGDAIGGASADERAQLLSGNFVAADPTLAR